MPLRRVVERCSQVAGHILRTNPVSAIRSGSVQQVHTAKASAGHVNNVVFYSYFDTVINDFLIKKGGLDIERGAVIGLAVESACRYRRSAAFPDALDAALRVTKLGNSSVRYEVGIFLASSGELAAAGHFVHVFVDRLTRRPVPIPDAIRSALRTVAVPSDSSTSTTSTSTTSTTSTTSS